MEQSSVRIQTAGVTLTADLMVGAEPRGIALLVHGGGPARRSSSMRLLAEQLNAVGLGTVLADLLTSAEGADDDRAVRLRFDVGLLAGRLAGVIDWLALQPAIARLPLGLFAAGIDAAAAFAAAARRPADVEALVSLGGRADRAGNLLAEVKAPALLVVDGTDQSMLEANKQVVDAVAGAAQLQVLPGATANPDADVVKQVALLSADWFVRNL